MKTLNINKTRKDIWNRMVGTSINIQANEIDWSKYEI